jgi:nitric oxide reductase subunit C
VGPVLDGVGSRRDLAYLKKWLTNPFDLKADSKMPKMPLAEKDIDELANFLANLK